MIVALKPLDFDSAGQGSMLKPLKAFLEDNTVSELLINKPYELYVERGSQMIRYEVEALSPSYLDELFQVIAIANRSQMSRTSPLFYGSLEDGTRVTLVVPQTARNFTLSFRRKVVNNFNQSDYLAQNYYRRTKVLSNLHDPRQMLNTQDFNLIKQYKQLVKQDSSTHHLDFQKKIDEFIISAVKARKTIVLSGGTSSGKTTYLNYLMSAISSDDRIITLEDTRELEVTQPNWVSLKATSGNQDEAQIEMKELVKACLRLRPDRIIMGEIRGAEIMNFCSAAKTGHSGSITTVHADDPESAFQQLATYYKYNKVVMSDEDIMNTLKSVIDVVIQLGKEQDGRMAQAIWYKHAELEIADV